MGITNSNKFINKEQINCDGDFKVTLALSAAPDISENPTDIVLVLDRSGSMSGAPLANMKLGAKAFVDIIDQSTDNHQNGHIGSGSHIGIVSFADSAIINTSLITNVQDLKTAIDGLSAGGSTNHADAFTKATQLLTGTSTNAKVIVMFTDVTTTAGPLPGPVAAAARAAGIIIYVIGLVGEDGIDVAALNEWATDPDASHVAITPDEEDLEELFKNLAANISKTGATNIVIDEVVNDDFIITCIMPPTKGTATMKSPTSIQWKIPRLGVSGNEGATLEFHVRHRGTASGNKLVNKSITYSDSEGNKVTFPNPRIEVDCGVIVTPEPCPVAVPISVGKCNRSTTVDLHDVVLESTGSIVALDLTLKNICSGRRVALAVVLTEVDTNGLEHERGMKIMEIPAHNFPTCRDIDVKCIRFVLPATLDVSSGSPERTCGTRHLRVRSYANYIDSGFDCCGELEEVR